MTYEQMMQIVENEKVEYLETTFPDGLKGLYKNRRIGISKSLNNTEKKCTLTEELGHHFTSVGDITNQNCVNNRKQELRARIWAYNEQVGLLGIINAYENRCKNLLEIAEFLDVTEEFLSDALNYYKNKYGIYVKIDNYILYFSPNLYVMKYLK
jgi:hypothetical protein